LHLHDIASHLVGLDWCLHFPNPSLAAGKCHFERLLSSWWKVQQRLAKNTLSRKRLLSHLLKICVSDEAVEWLLKWW